MMENAKIQKFKCNILSHFQTIFSSEQVLEMVTRLAFLGSETYPILKNPVIINGLGCKKYFEFSEFID